MPSHPIQAPKGKNGGDQKWVDGGASVDWVGFGRTCLDWRVVRRPPGVVLPVNPSRLLVWKHLQKFDPSAYPSAAVSDPSGLGIVTVPPIREDVHDLCLSDGID